MAAVQMNIRIDEELKARGDAVFARCGLTPSQVVRVVWEYADRTGEPPAFLRERPAPDVEAERQRKTELATAGGRIFSELAESLGLQPEGSRGIESRSLSENEYFGKSVAELNDDERRLAYYDDVRLEAYREKEMRRAAYE